MGEIIDGWNEGSDELSRFGAITNFRSWFRFIPYDVTDLLIYEDLVGGLLLPDYDDEMIIGGER